MKNIILILLTLVSLNNTYGQSLNWSTANDNNRMAYLNFGYDFGLSTQIGYGHKIKSTIPFWVTLDLSKPMGKQFLDDYKARFGAQLPILNKNQFVLSTKLYTNFKRHQNSFVRMAGFGAELSLVGGIYKEKWHLEGEFGFAKSITTQLKHFELMRAHFEDVEDGWYLASGGYWFYDVRISKSLTRNFLLSLELGVTNAQGKHVDALLPRYVQIGVIKMF